MSPRKRKQSDPPESPITPSKRTRLQQKSSGTPSQSTSGYPACKVGKQATIYGISGILDENEDHYLIDWGNPYDPSWVGTMLLTLLDFVDIKNNFSDISLSEARSPVISPLPKILTGGPAT